MQSQTASAILRNKFEELCFRGREVKFFPGSAVDFVLHRLNELIREFPEVSPFRDVLPYKFVGVFNGAFLPCGIRVGKIDGSAEDLSDFLVAGELGPVVRRNCQHVFTVWQEQLYNHVCHRFRVLAVRQPCHEEVILGTLAQGQYRALLPLAYDKVHFPVAETSAVGFRRPVVDVAYLGFPGNFDMTPVFQLMAAMAAEFPAFITPYPFVYRLWDMCFELRER